jgi:hypothetical protein
VLLFGILDFNKIWCQSTLKPVAVLALTELPFDRDALQVPMDQIGRAAAQFQADIAGLTFGGTYQCSNIRQHILELRKLLADDMDIWIGGEGVCRLRRLPAGITKFSSLEDLPVPAEAPGAQHEAREETA